VRDIIYFTCVQIRSRIGSSQIMASGSNTQQDRFDWGLQNGA